MNRVTVFGGSGFLGRQIVLRLAGQGKRVTVAVRDPRRADFPELGMQREGVTALHADVRDRDSVKKAIEGADAVINAVGLYVERGGVTFRAVHVDGAQTVAREAQSAGVERHVLISGLGIDPGSPSAYIRARAEGEARVREAFETATVLRPSAIFGPGDALLRSLVRLARVSPVIPLFGRGDTRLQPVFVGDVAAAASAVLDLASSAGKVYELGGPRVYTYRALVELVSERLGLRRFLLPVPFLAWNLQTALLRLLPNPPLTRDQVILMQRDNIVGQGLPTLADLGIEPTSIETELPL